MFRTVTLAMAVFLDEGIMIAYCAPAEEAPERLDAVTAVAFPACHGALTGGPALTTVGHWPT